MLILPFNPNFGPTAVRRPFFLKKLLTSLSSTIWKDHADKDELPYSPTDMAGFAAGGGSDFTTVVSDRDEIELRVHWARARERDIWEAQWSLAAIVEMLKKRYTLVRVIYVLGLLWLHYISHCS